MSRLAEAAAARLSRLLAMVPWLEQHSGVSIQEAAEHFGVSRADFERDLWLTVCCGLPGHGPDQLIDIQFWDDDGSINVIDPQTLDRPLRLSASEAMSLIVGLRLLAQVPGGHDRAALASATAKLESAAGIAQGAATFVDDDVDGEIALRVSEAIASQRAVRLVYVGASRDEETQRVVEPAEILRHRGRSYVSGWCREAGSERTFRLDRVRSAEILDEIVEPRAVRSSVAPDRAEDVRLRVNPRARWLLEGWDCADVVDLPDGAIEATVTVADRDWLVRIVLGQGGAVEVVSPAEVRQQVREAAERALGGPDPG